MGRHVKPSGRKDRSHGYTPNGHRIAELAETRGGVVTNGGDHYKVTHPGYIGFASVPRHNVLATGTFWAIVSALVAIGLGCLIFGPDAIFTAFWQFALHLAG